MTSPDARKKDEVAWAAGSSRAGLAGCWRIAERKRNKIQRKVLTVYTYSVLDSAIVLPLSYLFIFLFIYTMYSSFSFYIFRVVVVLLSLLDATRNTTKIQHTQTEQPGGLGKTRREINAASLFLIVILFVLFSIVVICFSL